MFKNYKYTSYLINIFKKVLGSKFTITGIENIPTQPTLFVANHFTRSETFFVPYIIFNKTGKVVRCLADSSLFFGSFGRFLKSLGALSTKEKDRNNIILRDLLEGENNWMIYPEGSMIKSKEIKNTKGFVSHTPFRVGRTRTGSAVLAIKSEIYRKLLIQAHDNNDKEKLDYYNKEYGLTYNENLRNLETYITPLTITYYPIRPGENKIKNIAARFLKKIPPKISEELEIEGNMLLDSEINIHFGKAIKVSEYINSARNVIFQIPIIKDETKADLVVKYLKYNLTYHFMSDIYFNIKINMDHIFAAALNYIKEEEITIDYLKDVIFYSVCMINKVNKFFLSEEIKLENISKIYLDNDYKNFTSILDLAKQQNFIKIINNKIKINKKKFNEELDFNFARMNSTLRVIFNEFSLLENAAILVKKTINYSEANLKAKVINEIIDYDRENYISDYKQYFDQEFSKDQEIGYPQLLIPNNIPKKGILLCHGYKSSPKEVEYLAKYLNNLGFITYSVRLKGHGTSPINLKYINWQDWIDSIKIGYLILHKMCDEVSLIGFSTGGLLSLNLSSILEENENKLKKIVIINPALRVRDIRIKMVPGIKLWNELLEKFSIEKGKFEYVNDAPENPHINYSRNYLVGVLQLSMLMKQTEKILSKVSKPLLIIQSSNDQVVDPEGGEIIYKNISSEDKKIVKIETNKHVIVTSDKKEEVFMEIEKFILN